MDLCGTNYYAIKKIPKETKDLIIELLNEDKYDESIGMLNNSYEKIHIGKSSGGWKFLFDYNHFKYYDLNRESINDFLNREDITLYDEYGEEIPIDDFWNMVDSKKDLLDNKTYYSEKENYCFAVLEEHVPYDLKNYDVECYEFYSDGLRFSSTIDFS